MTAKTASIDTKIQLSVNELFGKFGTAQEEDREEMRDILNEFIFYWSLESINNGLDQQIIAKGLLLYFFFTNVLREIEISFEEEIE